MDVGSALGKVDFESLRVYVCSPWSLEYNGPPFTSGASGLRKFFDLVLMDSPVGDDLRSKWTSYSIQPIHVLHDLLNTMGHLLPVEPWN